MPTTPVPLYHVHDFPLRSETPHENPFLVEVSATFSHDGGGEIRNIPGFYDGDGTWKVRFSPTQEGNWHGTTSSSDPELDGIDLGIVSCTSSDNPDAHGRVRLDPRYPRRFVFEDGTPFVPLGFECDWLFALHQSKPGAFSKALDLLVRRGFNYLVTNVYAHAGFSDPNEEWVFSPPDRFPFGGTNEEPDHSVLNVEFFRDLDETLDALHRSGIVVHLMIQVQNKHVNWPRHYSPQDNLYWRYVLARYQAYANLVWDISKESFNFVRQFDDEEYVLDRIAFVRETDAYDHLVTVHDAVANSPATSSAADEAADFVSDQIHLADIDDYNREAIRRFRTLDKPYMNIEYGYEEGAEPIKTYHSRTTRPWQDVLLWTYAIILGGGYATYYYSNTSWDLVKFSPEPPGWKRYEYLSSFLSGVDINPMVPDNEYVDRGYCLAERGAQYLVFLPEGGHVRLDLTAVPPSRTIEAVWMNINTGEQVYASTEEGRFLTLLSNPLSDDNAPAIVYVRPIGGDDAREDAAAAEMSLLLGRRSEEPVSTPVT